jgi:DNA (cytosine-5)-methyltransferase 1
MTHGSLFSGIGGFDLAAEWMGWKNEFHCEWNPFGQKVLKHYWPNAKSHEDITKTDFTPYRGTIDIVSGGFPCQPYSSAGKRKGKEDERHLWPEMLRAIREISPRYVVGENVLGLTNWNGGIVFNEVHIDLEREGYEVAAMVVPAAAVNAPHGRDRVWFVAKRIVANPVCGSNGNDGGKNVGTSGEVRRGSSGDVLDELCGVGDVADANGERPDIRAHSTEIPRDVVSTNTKSVVADAKGERFVERDGKNIGNVPTPHGPKQFSRPTRWEAFPTQPPVCGGNDGVPAGLDGITFPKWRNESLKAYGNAIVPQVAYEIFKTIAEADRVYAEREKQLSIV